MEVIKISILVEERVHYSNRMLYWLHVSINSLARFNFGEKIFWTSQFIMNAIWSERSISKKGRLKSREYSIIYL